MATGVLLTYCVTDDVVYYIDFSDWNTIRRVNASGTVPEVYFQFDQRITTLNAADGILYFSFNVVNEEQDGFIVASEITVNDLNTKSMLYHTKADTGPLCTGPDGMYISINTAKEWHGIQWIVPDRYLK